MFFSKQFACLASLLVPALIGGSDSLAIEDVGEQKEIYFYVATYLYDNDTLVISTERNDAFGRYCQSKEGVLALASDKFLVAKFIDCNLKNVESVSSWLGAGRTAQVHCESCDLDSESLGKQAKNWRVTHLYLSQCRINSEKPFELGAANLLLFSIRQCSVKSVNSPVLVNLGKCKSLKNLILEGMRVDSVQHLSGCDALSSIQVIKCEVGEECLASVGDLKIDRLTVDSCDFDESSLSSIALIHSLKTLRIKGESVSAANISYWGDKLPDLATLTLEEIELKPDHLRALTRLPKLKALRLISCGVSDDLLSALPSIEMLTQLSLRNNPDLTNNAVDVIVRTCQNLKSLDVEGCSLSDDGIITAARLKDISTIYCSAEHISENVASRIFLATLKRVIIIRW
ncbi:hypothetical protein Psta_0346 [Pirellula staleyi DSM 6068]|uniref:Leucine Rich repeats (2 copies) n=1 Tax=Pirellula staleyi (strain ATCC 27377 / DSM 6068 / ICPB 4128) TaxID=530564 RepID=D2R2C7_PIRSD|nr:hypothetical protein [Pirellula staleyi]ADB15036.1 hypothetical protein Psta_0346 [Pirellula staleyi DSM 6068]